VCSLCYSFKHRSLFPYWPPFHFHAHFHFSPWEILCILYSVKCCDLWLLFIASTSMATTKDGGTVKAVLLPALQKLNEELTKLVENIRKNFEAMRSDRLDEFMNVDCKVGLFHSCPMLLYLYCMKEVGVKTTHAHTHPHTLHPHTHCDSLKLPLHLCYVCIGNFSDSPRTNIE